MYPEGRGKNRAWPEGHFSSATNERTEDGKQMVRLVKRHKSRGYHSNDPKLCILTPVEEDCVYKFNVSVHLSVIA